MKMDHPHPIQLAALPFRFEGTSCAFYPSPPGRRSAGCCPRAGPEEPEPHQAAEREALEEAGVKGKVKKACLGEYTYFKRLSEGSVLCEVRVFPLEVRQQLPKWKEQNQRDQAWFTPAEAAGLVDEPELASLLRISPRCCSAPRPARPPGRAPERAIGERGTRTGQLPRAAPLP